MTSAETRPPFHLAFPVVDIATTRAFYGEVIGCRVGRSAERWIDFDFFGHQISAHLVDDVDSAATNPVDGDNVPARHFGAVLPRAEWDALIERLRGADVAFDIGPRIRFEGEVGEQARS